MASDIQKFIDSLNTEINEKNIKDNYIRRLARFLRGREHSLHVAETQTGLDISWRMLQDVAQQNNFTFLDMKPYFERSAKAKKSKNGGWYMVIPIRNTVSKLKPAYNANYWNDIVSKMDYGNTDNSLDPKKLQAILQGANSTNGTVPELNYSWKSSNVTRVPLGTNRGKYISFRTVSNNSDPMSWIVGKQQMSNQIQNNNANNVHQLAKYVSKVIKNHIDEFNKDNPIGLYDQLSLF